MDVERYLRDPIEFYREQIILDSGERFGDVATGWQLELLREIEGGERRYLWFECPRGFGKSGLLAMVAVKGLVLGRAGARIYSAAGDMDQAAIVANEVAEIFRRNPPLATGVRTGKYGARIPEKGCVYTALASDAPTSWGLKPDLVLIDELTNWTGRELFDSLMSATGKLPNARLFVATNAGYPATWQADVREVARSSASWHFHSAGSAAEGEAPWITRDWIEDQRMMLPPSIFARVIENRWVSGEGEFLTPEQVAAVTDPDLHEVTSRPRRADGRRRFVGLDLGLSHDATACATIHVSEGRELVLDRLAVWQGSRQQPVRYAAVEGELDFLREIFGSVTIVADQWNLQKLEQDRPDLNLEMVSFGSQKLYAEISQALRQVVVNHRIRLYPDAGETWHRGVRHTLQSQLVQLEVIENNFGYRFDHRTGGFSDMAVALGLAVHRALQSPIFGSSKPLLGARRRMADPEIIPGERARGALTGRRRKSRFESSSRLPI